VKSKNYLREECEVPVARLQATWLDLVRRVTRTDEGDGPVATGTRPDHDGLL
jgi:hypothetical protein